MFESFKKFFRGLDSKMMQGGREYMIEDQCKKFEERYCKPGGYPEYPRASTVTSIYTSTTTRNKIFYHPASYSKRWKR